MIKEVLSSFFLFVVNAYYCREIMKNPENKYLKAGILAFIFIFPSILGLFHAAHEHQNKHCFAKNEQHIHAQKESCSQFHILQNISFDTVQKVFELIPFEQFKEPFLLSCIFSEQLRAFNFQLRGPPVINALF